MGICCCSPLVQPGAFVLPDKILRVNHKTKDEAIGVISRSFAGTAATDPEGTMDWLLGPLLQAKWDDPRRLKLMEWFIRFVYTMQVEKNGGFALAAKKEDGTMGAVVIVKAFDKGMPGDGANCCRAILPALCKHGLLPLKDMGDAKNGIKLRMDSLQVIDKLHKKHMPGRHMYVNIMAVDPTSQGMGFCGLLMRFINGYADERKLPLYLETSGVRNVKIYERFGYTSVEQFTITCSKDPDNSEPHTDEFAMIRPAAV